MLLVEDNKLDRLAVRSLLSEINFLSVVVESVDTLAAGLKRIDACDFVVLDLTLLDSTPLQTIQRIEDFSSKKPIMVMSGNSNRPTVYDVGRCGSCFFLPKLLFNSMFLVGFYYSLGAASRKGFLRPEVKECIQKELFG